MEDVLGSSDAIIRSSLKIKITHPIVRNAERHGLTYVRMEAKICDRNATIVLMMNC